LRDAPMHPGHHIIETFLRLDQLACATADGGEASQERSIYR
jgi:hypothetical protein